MNTTTMRVSVPPGGKVKFRIVAFEPEFGDVRGSFTFEMQTDDSLNRMLFFGDRSDVETALHEIEIVRVRPPGEPGPDTTPKPVRDIEEAYQP